MLNFQLKLNNFIKLRYYYFFAFILQKVKKCIVLNKITHYPAEKIKKYKLMIKKPQYSKKTNIKLKAALFLILSYLFCQSIFSQSIFSQSITWQRTYSKNIQAIGNDVCQTTDGNFVIGGTSLVAGFGYGVFALKIDDKGDTLWTSTPLLISGHPYEGLAITATVDGGIVIVGSGDSTFMVKLNQTGDIVWLNFYQGYTTQCFDIMTTLDGGFIACGRNFSFNSEGFVIKINSMSQLEWQRIYSGLLGTFNSIGNAPGGGYIIAGNYNFPGNDTAKAILLRIDNNGDTFWVKKYKVNNRGASAKKIIPLNQCYLIAGSTGDSLNIGQLFFMRTDFNGNTTYVKVFQNNSFYNNYFDDISVINSNKYVIGYERDSSSVLFLNAIALITDSLGTIIKKNVFTSEPYFRWGSLRSIIPLTSGDILFAGTAKLNPSTTIVVYAVRTDSLLNTPTYIGITNGSALVPGKFILHQNFPNPFNSSTDVLYEIKEKSNVRIEIYDILGRGVKLLVNKLNEIGKFKVNLNLNEFSSGLYLLKLSINNTNYQIIKMILIK